MLTKYRNIDSIILIIIINDKVSLLHAKLKGQVTELAVSRKEAKYSCLPRVFFFVPIVFDTLGAIAPGSLELLTEVGRRLSAANGR